MSQFFFTGQCLLLRFLWPCTVDSDRMRRRFCFRTVLCSCVVLKCIPCYMLPCCFPQLTVKHTHHSTVFSTHWKHLQYYTMEHTHHSLLVLSTHLRDCCTQRKCHLLTNWLRDCTHGELVDQLVWPNIIGWKTEDGCFVPQYILWHQIFKN